MLVAKLEAQESVWSWLVALLPWGELMSTTVINPQKILQVVFARVSADQTTTSATPVDLTGTQLTFNKISAGSTVFALATFASSNTSALGATTTLQLNLAASARDGSAQTFPALANSTQSGAISEHFTGLAAGAQTFKLQWFTTAGTARIRPVAAAGAEHASLTLVEYLP